MNSRRINIITGLIGLALMVTFVIGLAHSVSTGFAGLIGGLPFTIIVAFVVLMATYDYWDQCVRKRRK